MAAQMQKNQQILWPQPISAVQTYIDLVISLFIAVVQSLHHHDLNEGNALSRNSIRIYLSFNKLLLEVIPKNKICLNYLDGKLLIFI